MGLGVPCRTGRFPFDGIPGFTQRDDVPALAAALARLIAGPAERHRFGEAKRARADSLLTVGRMVRELQGRYAELAACPRGLPIAAPYKRLSSRPAPAQALQH